MRCAVPTSILLVLWAAGARAEGPSGSLLAFVAAPPAQQATDPAVTLPVTPFRVEAGDQLVYLVRSDAAGAGARGVEVVYDGGRRSPAPRTPEGEGWHEVRVPLRGGARVGAFDLVARGERGAPIAFGVDDVRVERADGTTLDLFRDALPGGLRRAAGAESAAGAVVVPHDAAFAPDHVSLDDAVSDPWSAIDLAGLRALERGDDPAVGLDLPRGFVWSGPCVPLRYAPATGRAAIVARGQRIGLDPLDGGRFYELWIAVLNATGDEIATELGLVAVDGTRATIPVRVPARGAAPRPGEGHPARGHALLSIDVASTTSLASFQLPDDPRIAVLAVSIAWRRDGAADARFRARWIARAAETRAGLEESDREALRGYLANRRAGASFGSVDGEADADREIFDALLEGKLRTLRARVAERLEAQAAAAAGRKSARVDLLAALARPADDLAAALAPGLLPDDLPVLGGDARSLAELERRDPAALERLRARVAAGTWTPFGATFDAAGSARLGADTLARRIAREQRAVARLAGRAGAVARVDADLARLRALPPVLASAGISLALLDASPAGGAFARLSSAGADLAVFAPPVRAEGALRFDAAFWRPWTAAATAPGGRPPIPVLCDVSAPVARETLEFAAEIDASLVAPDLAWRGLHEVAGASSARMSILDPGAPDALARGGLAAELIARAAVRAAEVELARASAVEALAAFEGSPVDPRVARGWDDLLDAASREPRDATRAALAIAARVRGTAVERLAALRVALPPPGAGVPFAVLDPLPWARRALVELPGADLRAASEAGDLPMQRTSDGTTLVEIAGRGPAPAALRVRRDELVELSAPPRVRLEGWTVRTDDLVVAVDPKSGRVERVAARAGEGREVELLRGTDQLLWTGADGAVETIDGLESIEFLERGPLRARIRAVRSSPRARVVTEILVTAGAAGVEVRSRVEPRDSSGDVVHAFPLAHAAANAVLAVPFGATPLPPEAAAWRALDGWAAATDGTATFALLADGGRAFRWHDRSFGVLLAESGADGVREHAFRVLARAGGLRPAGLDVVAAERARAPVVAAFDLDHDPRGVSPATRRTEPREPIVRVARVERDGRRTSGPAGGIDVVCIEPGPDGALDVRLLETRGESATVEIAFGREPFGAERLDLLGAASTPLTTAGRGLTLSLGAGRFDVVRARLSP